jgi:hypothetical protein
MNSVIIAEYKSMAGKEPLTDFLQKWASPLIVKQKTVVDLRKTLLKDLYIQERINKHIATRFMTLTDSMPSNDFINNAVVSLTEQGFDDIHIDNYIKMTPEFTNKHVGISIELWKALKDSEPNIELMHSYASRFVTDSTYDIEKLKMDISAYNDPIVSSALLVNRVNEIENGTFVINRTNTNTYEQSTDKYIPFVEAFDTQFGRAMTARELIRYIPLMKNITDIDTYLWKERDFFDRAFEKVREIYTGYLQKDIDINYFISRHISILDLLDSKDYIHNLKNECMREQKYKEIMTEKITTIYFERYRFPIDVKDLEKMFEGLQSNSIMVTDNTAIVNTIDTYVLQMEDFLSKVADIYHSHLNRTLEDDEEQECKDNYRLGKVDLNDVSELIRNSYEYLDIVKAMVMRLCTEAGVAITSARTCKAVQLVMNDSDKSLVSLQRKISTMIKEKTI